MEAGFTRFRPVLMTALAMIIGMAPMALSAEQNAPLGRAVIGGLLCATVATLFFVPSFSASPMRTRAAPGCPPDGANSLPPPMLSPEDHTDELRRRAARRAKPRRLGLLGVVRPVHGESRPPRSAS